MRVEATVALLAMAGCGDDQQPEQADALWQRIHDEGYREFATAPGYEAAMPSDAPHSDNTQVFINATVEEALGGPAISEWPVGSLIVKDGTSDDGELELVAVLDKRSDGWFWAEYDEAGDAMYSGRPDICVDCHTDATSDFVFVLSLPTD